MIKLIATDLDGTLIGNDSEFHLHSNFREKLDHYRQKYGAEWAICTGRSLRSFERVLEPMATIGLEPDYVIIHHAYIYHRGRNRFRPQMLWNLSIRLQIWSSSLYLRGALREWQKMVSELISGVTTIYQRRNRLCLRFKTEQDAEVAADVLQKKAQVFKHLRVFRYLQEVDVRTVPFTKGMAVEALASRLGVKPSEIMCIGNGHNDISMLDGRCAAHVGCPGNAETDVMEVVHHAGGHISKQRGLGGSIDVMNAYMTGAVDSSYPEWWVPSRNMKNPRSMGRSMGHAKHRGKRPSSQRMAIQLGVLIAYAVLVVFASFGLVPFSGIIMKPFNMVARLVEFILVRI